MNILLIFLVTVLGSCFFNASIAHAQGQTEKEAERLLVDDFEKPGPQNALGGNHGAFSDPSGLGSCYVFSYTKAEQVFGGKGYSLYIQWDTSRQGSYGGYWTDIKHLDLTNFNYLSFYVKGLKGGEKFKIGLRGKVDAAYETKIPIEETLKTEISTEWRKVTTPLKLFKSIQEWNDINIFSINFEYAFGSEKGAILIDEINFEK